MRGAKAPAPERLLVTADEAAKLLSVSRRAVWMLAAAGDLPRVRLGPRSTRFRRSDLLALIERRAERT